MVSSVECPMCKNNMVLNQSNDDGKSLMEFYSCPKCGLKRKKIYSGVDYQRKKGQNGNRTNESR